MRIAELIRRRLRERTGGVDAASDVTVAVAANVGERRAATAVSSTSRRPRNARR